MAGSQDIGNGFGYIYLTQPDGVTIKSVVNNDAAGVNTARIVGVGASPLATRRGAFGVLTILTSVGSGTITAVTVNGVNQIDSVIAVASVTPSVVATQIANAINAFSPGSGLNFTATAIGANVYLFAPESSGDTANGFTITLTITGAAVTYSAVPFANGSNGGGIYDPVSGTRFFLNADYGTIGIPGSTPANPTSLTYAIEVTKYIINRGLQVGIVNKNLTISNDSLSGIDRSSALTLVYAQTQGATATDNLGYINPAEFQEGDILYLRAFDGANVITVDDASVSTVATPNIYLASTISFVTTAQNCLMLQFKNDSVLGPVFNELIRTIDAPSALTPAGISSVTYAQLRSLMTASQLIPGSYYLISDFATIYDQPDYDSGGGLKGTLVTKTASLEPLIVFAPVVDNISDVAISTLYPTDEIKYDVFFDTTEIMGAPAKGRITGRVDSNNNKTDYDHKSVVFKRYLSGGVYNSYKDNGAASVEVGTFGVGSFNNKLGESGTAGSVLLPNNVFGSGYNNVFGYNCINNTIGSSSNSNIIGDYFHTNIIGDNFGYNQIGSFIQLNVFGDLFSGNIMGNTCIGNVVGILFEQNNISNGFSGNVISQSFQRNTIGNGFGGNTIGTNFKENKIDGLAQANTIGNNARNNTIGSDFEDNIILLNFHSNTLGANFKVNNLGSNCSNNNIGHDVDNNSFGSGFANNSIVRPMNGTTFAGSGAKNNTFGGNLSSVDFSPATHVYAAYECTTFNNSAGTLRLSYFLLDILTVVNPTA